MKTLKIEITAETEDGIQLQQGIIVDNLNESRDQMRDILGAFHAALLRLQGKISEHKNAIL